MPYLLSGVFVRTLRPHLKQRNKLQRPALLPKTSPYTRASGKLDVPWLKSGTQEVQQEVERFHRDQLLQLRSDKNWQSQRTEKREKTLHVFCRFADSAGAWHGALQLE